MVSLLTWSTNSPGSQGTNNFFSLYFSSVIKIGSFCFCQPLEAVRQCGNQGMEQRKINENPDMDKVSVAHVSDVSHVLKVEVGRERLSDRLPPHESYEGRHRWDPDLTWTADEERKVVRKTDFYLLSCLCLMVRFSSSLLCLFSFLLPPMEYMQCQVTYSLWEI
jgi:hypothetical protein